MEKNGKSYFKIIFTAVIIFIITFIPDILIPNFRKGHAPSKEKGCYSNIRVLQGAVEMYNMDNEEMMTELNANILVDSKYLKSIPKGTEPECKYFTKGNLTEDGEICCKLHGGLISEGDPDVVGKKEMQLTIKSIKGLLTVLFLHAIPSFIYLFFALL